MSRRLLPLCSDTTGASPCPFSNRAIAPSDTFDVLPGNVAAVMRVRPDATLTNVDFSIDDDGQLVNEGTVDNSSYLCTLIDASNDPPGDPDNPTIDNRGLFVNHAGTDVPNDGAFRNSGTFTSAGEVTNTVYERAARFVRLR